jgi:hypothetical protein
VALPGGLPEALVEAAPPSRRVDAGHLAVVVEPEVERHRGSRVRQGGARPRRVHGRPAQGVARQQRGRVPHRLRQVPVQGARVHLRSPRLTVQREHGEKGRLAGAPAVDVGVAHAQVEAPPQVDACVPDEARGGRRHHVPGREGKPVLAVQAGPQLAGLAQARHADRPLALAQDVPQVAGHRRGRGEGVEGDAPAGVRLPGRRLEQLADALRGSLDEPAHDEDNRGEGGHANGQRPLRRARHPGPIVPRTTASRCPRAGRHGRPAARATG